MYNNVLTCNVLLIAVFLLFYYAVYINTDVGPSLWVSVYPVK